MPGGEPLDQDKLARYLAARDKLGLELVDAAGRSIRTAAIHIADYTASRGQGAIELDVLIKDSSFRIGDSKFVLQGTGSALINTAVTDPYTGNVSLQKAYATLS